MKFKTDNPEDSAMKSLHESDSKLTAGLAIMDAFPLGMLGFMAVKERAKSEGKIDEFDQKVNQMAEDVAQKIDEAALTN